MLRHDEICQKIRDGELVILPAPSQEWPNHFVFLHLGSDAVLSPGDDPKPYSTMERIAIRRSSNFFGMVRPHSSGHWDPSAMLPPAVSPDKILPGFDGNVDVLLLNGSDHVIRISKGERILVVSFHDINIRARIVKAAAAMKAVGAKEVYAFGSAANGWVSENSDIDLAVSGLPPEKYFEAMAQATSVLDWPVDLVDLDEKTPFAEHLNQLKAEGKLDRVA